MTRVGYIGLGQMGAAMAGWLNSTDTELTVFDISPDAMAPLVGGGATAASSAAEVAATCDVVSVCVPAAHHVEAVLTGPGGIGEARMAGQTILLHSTVSPESMVASRDAAATWGAVVHDACIFGGVASAVKGELVVFAGGLADMSLDARAVLDTYGSLVLDCGPVGAGAALKIAANVMSYSQFMAASTAYEIARRVDADPTKVIDAWRHAGQLGVLTERFLPVLAMEPGTMPDSFRSFMQATTDIAVKDLDLASDMLGGSTRRAVIEALAASMGEVYGVELPDQEATT